MTDHIGHVEHDFVRPRLGERVRDVLLVVGPRHPIGLVALAVVELEEVDQSQAVVGSDRVVRGRRRVEPDGLALVHLKGAGGLVDFEVLDLYDWDRVHAVAYDLDLRRVNQTDGISHSQVDHAARGGGGVVMADGDIGRRHLERTIAEVPCVEQRVAVRVQRIHRGEVDFRVDAYDVLRHVALVVGHGVHEALLDLHTRACGGHLVLLEGE